MTALLALPVSGIFFVVVFSSLPLPMVAQSSSEILDELYEDSGWIKVDSSNTGQVIYNKRLNGSDIPAIMVRQTTTVSPEFVISAIEDVEHYVNFLRGAYLERSDLLMQTSLFIVGYQYLDLPLMANRHYIYRMMKKVDSLEGIVRFDWTPVARDSEYSDFLDTMDLEFGFPLYITVNIGGWRITSLQNGEVEVTYRLFVDPGGLVPDFLIARGNRVTAPKMVKAMIDEAIRRESQ